MRPRAFRFAWRGVLRTFREEANFRVHLIVAEAILYLAFVERASATSWAILSLAVGLVVALELLNTAVERAVDLGTQGKHLPLAAAAKDASAGAVLAGSLSAAAVGFALLWAHLGMLAQIFRVPVDYVGLAALAVLVVLTLRPPLKKE
ncbi:MAG: diacylglycerol kinase family protein [Thermaerobacter sp.]|nr:diacylglycerol kinase family protein [Thermaerobacter sp.]